MVRHRRLILASRSFGRQLLLHHAGYTFVHAAPPFDDPPCPGATHEPAETVSAELARAKAESFLGHPDWAQHQPAVVLSADTLVAYDDGELAGKPTSRREARTMIQRFLDTDHRVVTGVALVGPEPGEIETFADTAVVHMGHISEKELENYVQSGSWHGKAGGYNLFDRQDAGWPIQVEGDPTTVVGLPMQRLGEALDRYGVRPNGVPQTPMAQPAAARPHTG